jgi:zinc protease
VSRQSIVCYALLCWFACGGALAQGVTLPDVVRVELDNGAVIILLEKHDVPLIGVEVNIRGGAIADLHGMDGTANLLAAMLNKGAAGRSAAQFAEAIDAVGGSLEAGAGLESINVSGEFMSRDTDLMVRLLTDMLRAPTLDDDEIVKLRDRQIDQIRAAKDSGPEALSPIYGNSSLFGDHPYGSPVDGSEETLARITPAELRAFYRRYFGGDRLVIAVAGDIDATDMLAKLSAAFGDWAPAPAPLPEVAAPVPVVGSRVLLIDKPGATQSYFWAGNVGVGRGYEQRAALDVANTQFGGAFTSMLMTGLRTNAGLTYDARSSLRRNTMGGSVAITSYTKTESTVEAMDLALSLLAEFREQGVPADMIAPRKNYILGQFAPRLETASQLAAQFAALETYGLDAGYVNEYGAAIVAADGDTIHAVINQVYPAANNMVFTVIGDADKIREQLTKYGPVTEMSISDPRFRPR